MREIRPLAPGDAGWVLERHGSHYCGNEGFDRSFEALVARRLAEVLRDPDSRGDRGWIAWERGIRLGSIFFAREADGAARLRLFYVVAEARGQGVGRALLDTLSVYARAMRCPLLRVATHAEHAEASRLYARAGFHRVSSAPVTSFGRALTEEHWEKPLAPL